MKEVKTMEEIKTIDDIISKLNGLDKDQEIEFQNSKVYLEVRQHGKVELETMSSYTGDFSITKAHSASLGSEIYYVQSNDGSFSLIIPEEIESRYSSAGGLDFSKNDDGLKISRKMQFVEHPSAKIKIIGNSDSKVYFHKPGEYQI